MIFARGEQKKKPWLVCLFVGILCSQVWSQSEPQVYENLDVTLQQIQANVVDKRGDTITGLTAADFQIMVGGKKQNIIDISEISLDSAQSKDGDAAVAELARRLFVFLFDLRYTTRLGLLNARKSAAEFISNKMTEKDIASVVIFHPDNGINILCSFTSDPELLRASVDTLGLVNSTVRGRAGYFANSAISRNFENLQGVNRQIDSIYESGGNTSTGLLGGNERLEFLQYDQQVLEHVADILQRSKRVEEDVYRSEVNRFLLQFQQFGNALKYIRGRKNLIWFSSGFDEKVLTGNTEAENRADQEAISRGEIWDVSADATGNVGIQSNLKDAVKMLQGSNTMIFAVDTGLNDNATGGQSGLQALNAFSKDTGGRLFRNTNDLSGPLEDIRLITNHYYLITFEPSADLKPAVNHRLKVKVARKGSDVFTRRSLTIAPDFKKLKPLDKQFHIAEYLARDVISNGVPLDVTFHTLPSEDPLKKVMVSADIPSSYFTAEDPKEKALFEVFLHAVRTTDDILFDASYYRFGMDAGKLSKSDKTKGVRYLADVFLEPGAYRLKIVVRDLNSGNVGSHIQNVTIAKEQKVLNGPFVMVREPWTVVRPDAKSQKEQRGGSLDYSYPFQIKGKMQIPGSPETFSSKGRHGFFYFLDKNHTQAATEAPRMNAFFMDEQQQVIQIPADAISAGTEFGKSRPYMTGVLFYIDFEKVGLQPGKNYKLCSQFVYPDEKPYRHMHPIRTGP